MFALQTIFNSFNLFAAMHVLDVNHIIQAGGIFLILAIIFAESGLMVGFFLPGDTLLIAAGVFAASGKLDVSLWVLIPSVALAAIAGDNLGYLIGQRYGRRLFKKPDGLIFRQEYVEKSEEFFGKYGDKTMLIAHFVPVVRTFAPVIAGVSKMNHKRFFIYDAIGDIVWAIVVTLIGYFFGSKIPNLDRYIMFVVAAAVIVSVAPVIYHAIQNHRKRRSAKTTDSSDD